MSAVLDERAISLAELVISEPDAGEAVFSSWPAITDLDRLRLQARLFGVETHCPAPDFCYRPEVTDPFGQASRKSDRRLEEEQSR